MIYLSHFAAHKEATGNLYAISNGVPDWAPMERFDLLVPAWSDVQAAKSGKMLWREFAQRYWHRLNDDAGNILGEAEHGDLRNATLFCWCTPGRACHRRVLAAWLHHHEVPVTLDGVLVTDAFRIGAAEHACGWCGRISLVDADGRFLPHDFPKQSGLVGLCDGVGLTLEQQDREHHAYELAMTESA